MPKLTTDAFLEGHLKITQEQDGYRFSLDAALLAASTAPRPGDHIVDLGTGCGVIPLILALRYPQVNIHAVEVQAELAALAHKNVQDNRMQAQIGVVQQDMRTLSVKDIGRPADWIVSNPPYHRSSSGRLNPNNQRALARHEINLNLSQLLQTVRRLLRTGGRFGIIFPCERTSDLLCEMRGKNIEPKWMRMIHSRFEDEAKLMLVQGIQNGKPGMTVAPPLAVYAQDEQYTPEVRRMLAP